MSDEELLAEISRGGPGAEPAVKLLYNNCGGQMLRFFIQQGADGDAAKDILQETLIKICKSAGTFGGSGSATAWIWQVARNCMHDHFRGQNRTRQTFVNVSDDEWADLAMVKAAPLVCLPGMSADECVAAGMTKFQEAMSERHYALTLFMEGHTMLEISERIGRTAAAAKEYISQCRKKIAPFIAHCNELLLS
jgi:RNA polymerase sigma factor (sigma-70 family)